MLKSKKQSIILAFVIGVFLVMATPAISHAAGLVPCGGPSESPCTVLDAFYMVARVTNWLIMTAGVFAVYNIINHAFWLAVSAGNEEDVTKHRSGITNSIIGMVVVFAAFMFMNTAVNGILRSKCKIDFRSPWTYIIMTDPHNVSQCAQPDPPGQPAGKGYNPANDNLYKN